MTFRAVVSYLDYRLKAKDEQTLFEIFVAENLATISSGNKYKKRMSYVQQRDELLGIKKKDTRSAKQIIEDTFAARGVKINWKKKGGSK